MKKCAILVALFAVGVLVRAVGSQSAATSETLRLVGGTVLDPVTGSAEQRDVYMRDGRIVEESAKDFAGETLDVTGKWIIPGLVDAHVHAWGNSSPAGSAQTYGIVAVAKRHLYAGVTGVLDLYNAEDDVIGLRDLQRASGFVAADLFSAGPCLTATRGHCSEYDMPTRLIDDVESAAREVGDLIRTKRPDVVKIVYDHNVTRLPTISKETLVSAIATANELGTKTVVHIGTWQDALDAVEAGASAITHTHLGEVPQELVDAMHARKAAFIPTLAVQLDLKNLVDQPALLDDALLVQMESPEFLADYRDETKFYAGYGHWLASQRTVDRQYAVAVKRLHDGGVTVLAGTDSGNVGTFHGWSLHRELELLVDAGLTPWEALRAATTDAGAFLGRRYGVRTGDVANLVVLGASPLEDIRNTRRVEAVVYRGRAVERAALLTKALRF